MTSCNEVAWRLLFQLSNLSDSLEVDLTRKGSRTDSAIQIRIPHGCSRIRPDKPALLLDLGAYNCIGNYGTKAPTRKSRKYKDHRSLDEDMSLNCSASLELPLAGDGIEDSAVSDWPGGESSVSYNEGTSEQEI